MTHTTTSAVSIATSSVIGMRSVVVDRTFRESLRPGRLVKSFSLASGVGAPMLTIDNTDYVDSVGRDDLLMIVSVQDNGGGCVVVSHLGVHWTRIEFLRDICRGWAASSQDSTSRSYRTRTNLTHRRSGSMGP